MEGQRVTEVSGMTKTSKKVFDKENGFYKKEKKRTN